MWKILLGIFGADALKRKFGDSPPEPWIQMLAQIPDAHLRRGLRKLPFTGWPHVPSLPQFIKLCRDPEDDAPPRLTHHAPEARSWLSAGNSHLFAYLMRVNLTRPTWFGPLPTDMSGPTHPLADEATRWCVEAKDQWVADMDDISTHNGGSVPLDIQREVWKSCMDPVEKRIAARPYNLEHSEPAGYAAGRGIRIADRHGFGARVNERSFGF